MVRRDGLVKVLDFGIAKLIRQEDTDTEAKSRQEARGAAND